MAGVFQATTRDDLIAWLRNRSRGARGPLFLGEWMCAIHVVVVEDGVWRIRRAVFERARADANYAACGMYMPEPGEFEYKTGLEAPAARAGRHRGGTCRIDLGARRRQTPSPAQSMERQGNANAQPMRDRAPAAVTGGNQRAPR